MAVYSFVLVPTPLDESEINVQTNPYYKIIIYDYIWSIKEVKVYYFILKFQVFDILESECLLHYYLYATTLRIELVVTEL